MNLLVYYRERLRRTLVLLIALLTRMIVQLLPTKEWNLKLEKLKAKKSDNNRGNTIVLFSHSFT